MQHELKALQNELGISFVVVTHDQEEALTMSDRIAVLGDGKVQQLGSCTELYRKPRNVFTARFLGESNLLPARVLEKSADSHQFRLFDGQRVSLPADVIPEHGLGADAHLRSEEHTSELQSLMRTSYAVFCLNKKKN